MLASRISEKSPEFLSCQRLKENHVTTDGRFLGHLRLLRLLCRLLKGPAALPARRPTSPSTSANATTPPCIYVCMYMYVHVCMCVCVYTHTQCVYTHTHIHKHVYIYTTAPATTTPLPSPPFRFSPPPGFPRSAPACVRPLCQVPTCVCVCVYVCVCV